MAFEEVTECLNHLNAAEIECIMVAKFGVQTFRTICEMLNMPKIPKAYQDKIKDGIFKAVGFNLTEKEVKQVASILDKVPKESDTAEARRALSRYTNLPLQTHILSPPTDICLECGNVLVNSNKPVEVTIFTADRGPVPALKACLRCNACKLSYNYAMYGSKITGYQFYEQPQQYVEASDVSLFERTLCLSQVYLS